MILSKREVEHLRDRYRDEMKKGPTNHSAQTMTILDLIDTVDHADKVISRVASAVKEERSRLSRLKKPSSE